MLCIRCDIGALQLNTNAEIVTVVAPGVVRLPRMPGAIVKTDELELTYAHLTSMDNFSQMLATLAKGKADSEPVTEAAEAAPSE